MRAPLHTLVTLLVCVVPSSTRAAKHTLPELVALARTHSPTVRQPAAQVHVAEAQHSEALSLWAPTGTLTYVFTGAPDVQCRMTPSDQYYYAQILHRAPTPAERQQACVNTVDPTNGAANISYLSLNLAGVGMSIDASLTQPLYTFGKIENAIGASEHGIASYKAGVDAAEVGAAYDVARAYWGLKAARASIGTLQSARDELTPWVDKIEKDLDSDKPTYTESDLARLKVAVAQLNVVVINLERGEKIALNSLRTLVGDPDVDVDDAEFAPVDPPPGDVAAWQDDALRHRPEVKQLDEGVAGLRQVAKARRDEMLPDIGLNAGLSWRYAPTIEDSTSAFANHANQFGFGLFLALRQPLDLFAKRAHWLHAEADADVLDSQRSAAIDGIKLEVANAWANVDEAERRMNEYDKVQHTAQGWLNSIEQDMDLGTANPRDLVEAARVYFEQRMQYLNAINDYNVNVAALEKAAGVVK